MAMRGDEQCVSVLFSWCGADTLGYDRLSGEDRAKIGLAFFRGDGDVCGNFGDQLGENVEDGDAIYIYREIK